MNLSLTYAQGNLYSMVDELIEICCIAKKIFPLVLAITVAISNSIVDVNVDYVSDNLRL